LVLVIVIIGWAENDPAHAALRHERVFAFWWLSRRAFGLVKRAEMLLQNVMHHLFLGQPERVIESAHEQRLNGLSLGIFPDAESRHYAVRPLQNHLGNIEQRIRPS